MWKNISCNVSNIVISCCDNHGISIILHYYTVFWQELKIHNIYTKLRTQYTMSCRHYHFKNGLMSTGNPGP